MKCHPVYMVALWAALIVAGVSHVMVTDAPGIVAVEGWAHGIALCQGDVRDEPTEKIGKGWMWQTDGIMYVVNEGHMEDQEKDQLVVLAVSHCEQYKESK